MRIENIRFMAEYPKNIFDIMLNIEITNVTNHHQQTTN